MEEWCDQIEETAFGIERVTMFIVVVLGLVPYPVRFMGWIFAASCFGAINVAFFLVFLLDHTMPEKIKIKQQIESKNGEEAGIGGASFKEEKIMTEQELGTRENKKTIIMQKYIFYFERVILFRMFLSFYSSYLPRFLRQEAGAPIAFLFTNFAYFLVKIFLKLEEWEQKFGGRRILRGYDIDGINPEQEKIATDQLELGTQENNHENSNNGQEVNHDEEPVEKHERRRSQEIQQVITQQELLEMMKSIFDEGKKETQADYEEICKEKKWEENRRKWEEEEEKNLAAKLCAATASSEYYRSLLRDSEEKRSELGARLLVESATSQLYRCILHHFD